MERDSNRQFQIRKEKDELEIQSGHNDQTGMGNGILNQRPPFQSLVWATFCTENDLFSPFHKHRIESVLQRNRLSYFQLIGLHTSSGVGFFFFKPQRFYLIHVSKNHGRSQLQQAIEVQSKKSRGQEARNLNVLTFSFIKPDLKICGWDYNDLWIPKHFF